MQKMVGPSDSSSTDQLEFTSLQLDVQMMQKNREQNRLEFDELRDFVHDNFQSLHKTLGDLQSYLSTFISAFPKPREVQPIPQDVPQASTIAHTTRGTVNKFQDARQSPAIVGSATLVDKNTGKELNLDGTHKLPYKHPHFVENRQSNVEVKTQTAAHQVGPAQHVINMEEEQGDGLNAHLDRRFGIANRELAQDNRRVETLVKPAKYNIPKFDGTSTDSWTQTIEMYFVAARTPLEQKN